MFWSVLDRLRCGWPYIFGNSAGEAVRAGIPPCGHFPGSQTDFPIEIIRAETTSLPTGQQYFQWFYQKLEGSHQFYSASYMSPSIKLNLVVFYFWVIFRNKMWRHQRREKDLILFSFLSQLSN